MSHLHIESGSHNKYKCPEGNYLELKNGNVKLGKSIGSRYMANKKDCDKCSQREKCLNKKTSKVRTLFISRSTGLGDSNKRMIKKIDTEEGRYIYSKRMGIVEPVFGNISYAKNLNRINYRGFKRVNNQWLLFCMVHNIEKITNYGEMGKS